MQEKKAFFISNKFFFFFFVYLLTNRKMSAIIPSVDAAMAQLVEHILGKDEVPSSNLGSSSNKRHPEWDAFFAATRFELRSAKTRLYIRTSNRNSLCLLRGLRGGFAESGSSPCPQGSLWVAARAKGILNGMPFSLCIGKQYVKYFNALFCKYSYFSIILWVYPKGTILKGAFS